MKVKIIANKTIHEQQMSITEHIGKIIDAYRSPTGLVYGVDHNEGSFVLLDGEYEIVED